MKAFLLAAGLGTRLRPLTDKVPKCMLPIAGRPLLDYWLTSLTDAGVDEVLINLHHRPDVVSNYLGSRDRSSIGIKAVFEPQLLGSAGTLLANRDWMEDEEFFLACNADGLTDFGLDDLIIAHAASKPVATVVTHHARNPSANGILETDEYGVVMTGFTEKPDHPVSDLANAGMYAFSPAVLDEITGSRPQDIGRDLLPRLIGRAHAIPLVGYFLDIGTPEDYRLAQEEWIERASRSCSLLPERKHFS